MQYAWCLVTTKWEGPSSAAESREGDTESVSVSSLQSFVCSTQLLVVPAGSVSPSVSFSRLRHPIRSCSSCPDLPSARRKKAGRCCCDDRTHAASCATGEPRQRSSLKEEGRACSYSEVDQHERATSAQSRHAVAKAPREARGTIRKIRPASSESRRTSERVHACAEAWRRSAASCTMDVTCGCSTLYSARCVAGSRTADSSPRTPLASTASASASAASASASGPDRTVEAGGAAVRTVPRGGPPSRAVAPHCAGASARRGPTSAQSEAATPAAAVKSPGGGGCAGGGAAPASEAPSSREKRGVSLSTRPSPKARRWTAAIASWVQSCMLLSDRSVQVTRRHLTSLRSSPDSSSFFSPLL
mmetsp:Transcript_3595/g.11548  ORF Transcript_3595/g.11548 Transcript_3595/m.11548 type:complete len:360 (+) Transcript_3595:200-1279(+)